MTYPLLNQNLRLFEGWIQDIVADGGLLSYHRARFHAYKLIKDIQDRNLLYFGWEENNETEM